MVTVTFDSGGSVRRWSRIIDLNDDDYFIDNLEGAIRDDIDYWTRRASGQVAAEFCENHDLTDDGDCTALGLEVWERLERLLREEATTPVYLETD